MTSKTIFKYSFLSATDVAAVSALLKTNSEIEPDIERSNSFAMMKLLMQKRGNRLVIKKCIERRLKIMTAQDLIMHKQQIKMNELHSEAF